VTDEYNDDPADQTLLIVAARPQGYASDEEKHDVSK
jgi:hypothetical protein